MTIKPSIHVETRLVFRTEYADGSGLLSTGTRYGSGLTPDQFAVQLIERTRVQRPHLTEEFRVTVWEEDADADDYPLRDTPVPPGATTHLAPAQEQPMSDDTPTQERQSEHARRRNGDLVRKSKSDLVALYKQLGGLGGIHPPEKWRKDELITSIIDMEWARL